MQKNRTHNVPAIPRTLFELAETIQQFEPVRPIYSGSCTGTDGSVALIFISTEMMQLLRECAVLYGDGAFKVSLKLLIILKIRLFIINCEYTTLFRRDHQLQQM